MAGIFLALKAMLDTNTVFYVIKAHPIDGIKMVMRCRCYFGCSFWCFKGFHAKKNKMEHHGDG